jgi:hypothetical protein
MKEVKDNANRREDSSADSGPSEQATEPTEKSVSSESEDKIRLHALFQDTHDHDPFAVSFFNLPHKVITHYRAVQDISIIDIVAYITTYPDRAAAF